MATHSSILAWRIPWTEELGGLQSMGLLRVGQDWSDWAHTRRVLLLYFQSTYLFISVFHFLLGFPDSSVGKESACNAGDLGLIPGLGRSPGEGKDYRLQYSGLENSMDCIVHGVAKELDTAEWLSLPVISSKVFNRIEKNVYPSYISSLNDKAFSVSSLSIIFPVYFCITLSQWINSLLFFCCLHLWSFFFNYEPVWIF